MDAFLFGFYVANTVKMGYNISYKKRTGEKP